MTNVNRASYSGADSMPLDGETLEDLVAFVTGGTRGIGLGIVEHLLKKGASVCLTSRSPSGDEVVEDLCARFGSGRAFHLVGDVSSRGDVAACVDECVARFGTLDIVVANAGVDHGAPFLDMTEELWDEVVSVNLTGAFHTIQLAARKMAGRGGRIVVVASTNAFFVESNFTAYNASKAGLIGLVRSAAIELAPDAITVNAVSPGLVATRMTESLITHQVHGPDYLRHIPVGRFGVPADVAAAVGYLVSPAASWITGQQIVVDGGQTIGILVPAEIVESK